MVIQNGKIYTVDEFNPLVEAVAVKDGKLLPWGLKEIFPNGLEPKLRWSI